MLEQALRNEGFAEVNGAQLYFQEAGQGHPLVLLHAGVADHTMWNQQFNLFALKYRVVRYDLRGFGRSLMPAGEFQMHEDLRGLLDFLGIERAYLVGVSMGGSTVIDFTLAYPDRAVAIVPTAAGISGKPPSERSKELYAQMDEPYDAKDLETVLALEEQLWLIGPDRQPEAVAEELKGWFRRMERANLEREFQGEEGTRKPLDPPAVGRLGEIKVPTLYIAGDADLPDVISTAEMIAEQVPGAETVILPNVAHMVPMEAPDEFNRLVMQFLARYDAEW